VPGHRLNVKQLSLPIQLTLHHRRISGPHHTPSPPRGLFSSLLELVAS